MGSAASSSGVLGGTSAGRLRARITAPGGRRRGAGGRVSMPVSSAVTDNGPGNRVLHACSQGSLVMSGVYSGTIGALEVGCARRLPNGSVPSLYMRVCVTAGRSADRSAGECVVVALTTPHARTSTPMAMSTAGARAARRKPGPWPGAPMEVRGGIGGGACAAPRTTANPATAAQRGSSGAHATSAATTIGGTAGETVAGT